MHSRFIIRQTAAGSDDGVTGHTEQHTQLQTRQRHTVTCRDEPRLETAHLHIGADTVVLADAPQREAFVDDAEVGLGLRIGFLQHTVAVLRQEQLIEGLRDLVDHADA